MNILVLSWRDPKHPLAGGAEQVMHQHMKSWISAGHSLTLFSSKNKINLESEFLDGVKIIRSGNQYLGVQLKAFLYYINHPGEFDLVIDQFHGLPFFTPLYVKKPKLAVLQEVAKEVWFKNPLPFPINFIVGVLGYVFEPLIFLLYRNTKFMVGSNSAGSDLIKLGIKNKNISIVPHGVMIPSSNLIHNPLNPKVITFLGTLSKDKGIMDAIDVFEKLNRHADYNFWILGKAENENFDKKIKEKIKRLDLNDKVKFWGRVDDPKKFELLSKSYLLINPSIREGWGLVNIEANLVGTPVIAYPSVGLVDSVRNGISGIITRKSIPQNMVDEIEALVKSPDKYQKLSTGSRKWANSFSWEKSGKLSLSLIDSLV